MSKTCRFQKGNCLGGFRGVGYTEMVYAKFEMSEGLPKECS